MARLTAEEIKKEIESKGYTLIDASNYQNLQSPIQIKCSNGHLLETNLSSFRKSTFDCPVCIGEKTSNFGDNSVVPQKKGYRIVALDQASHKIGVSVYDNGQLVHYDWYEVIGTFEQRLKKIYEFLNSTVIYRWQPDFLVFEDIQYQQNPQMYKILAMVLGICVLSAEINNIKHEEILNKVWQSRFNITGATRVQQKNCVMKKVKEIFHIDVSDDTADAIMIGLYSTEKLSKHWEERLF